MLITDGTRTRAFRGYYIHGIPPKKTSDQRRANRLHKSLYMYIMSICLTNFQVCEHVSEKGSETNV